MIMKELSIEEKAKAYDDALERARKSHDKAHGLIKKEWVETIFPELKESENERIRKTLLKLVNDTNGEGFWNYYKVHKEEALAWLEKQGKQKEIDYDEEIKKCKANPLYFSDKYVKIKLKEQKPTDKVEPKFKVGDWVLWDNKICCHIDDIHQGEKYLVYTITDTNNLIRSYAIECFDKNARLWDITKDAKDGDVLVVNDNVFIYSHRKQMYSIAVAHCFVDSAGGFYLDGEFGYVEYGKTISPATKEECDLLFQKMKEKGYEWDYEKKKLKIVDWSKHAKCDPNPPSIGEESGYELDAEQSNEESNEGNCEIDGLYYAKTILEKTLGKVEGYQTDDGILEHKSAINAVTKLCDEINVTVDD